MATKRDASFNIAMIWCELFRAELSTSGGFLWKLFLQPIYREFLLGSIVRREYYTQWRGLILTPEFLCFMTVSLYMNRHRLDPR
jgi:hypothetical protein